MELDNLHLLSLSAHPATVFHPAYASTHFSPTLQRSTTSIACTHLSPTLALYVSSLQGTPSTNWVTERVADINMMVVPAAGSNMLVVLLLVVIWTTIAVSNNVLWYATMYLLQIKCA